MKTNAKDSLLDVGRHLGTGVLGMVAGSAVGRHSLILGALTIFGGAYYGKDWVTSAGVGMAVSNGFGNKPQTTMQGIDGFKEEMDNAKDRAVNSLKAIGKKLYIDKLSPALAQKLALGSTDQGDRPLVFMGSEVADQGDFDTSEVDEIIRKIEAGETVPSADLLENATNGLEGNLVEHDFGGLDVMDLNGSEDISELNAIA